LTDEPNRIPTRDERTFGLPMDFYLLAAHRSCEIIALLIRKALRNPCVLYRGVVTALLLSLFVIPAAYSLVHGRAQTPALIPSLKPLGQKTL